MTKQTLYSLVGILFVVSGALGLVYQIVWFKYLSLFLGNTTYAQTIVLATFMGGLALGAAHWGRKADTTRKPLVLYAWLELGIGAYCLLYPLVLSLLELFFVLSVRSMNLASDSSVVLLLKMTVSLISLLLPTILMGGTLPILVRFISAGVEESGKNTAILYFLNSLGAVIGTILTGFFFIRILGLSISIYAAAIVNLAIGAIAWKLGDFSTTSKNQKPLEESSTGSKYSDRQVSLAILTAGISGLAAMIYEVTWVRLLIPVLGSSTYSFSLMLVSFITGITLGSLIVWNLLGRVKDLFSLLAYCQLAVVVSILVTLPGYARVPYYFWQVASLFSRSEATYPIFLFTKFMFSFLIMIVPTTFLGMTLPIASRIGTRDFEFLGKSVGNVFSFNTAGTVVGALVAGLLLIPLIGVKHTIEVGLLCNLAMGLVVLFSHERMKQQAKVVIAGIVASSMMFYGFFEGSWNRGLSISGVFRLISENVAPVKSYQEFRSANDAVNILYYREGSSATVAVFQGLFQNKKQNVLLINGKADASSIGDLPTQLLIAQVPLVLHPNPRKALVIGLGSGVTAGSALTHPIESLDCVEISPEVVEASQYFNDVNNRPLEDPRLHLYLDDALAFLKLTSNTYDVIMSEPTNPWIAGVGNLYTVEFFQECKKRLEPGGLMVQWFHLYEMDDELLKLVLRTYRVAFPYVTVWQAQTTDIMIIGSTEAIQPDFDQLDAKLNRKKVIDDLARVQIPDAATFLSMHMMSSHSVKEYAGVDDVNTEDMPRLEYKAPEVFFINKGVRELARADERMSTGKRENFLFQRGLQKALTDDELYHIGMLHTSYTRGHMTFGYDLLARYAARNPKNVPALLRLAEVTEQMKRFEESMGYRKLVADLRPNDAEALAHYAWQKYSFDRSTANMLSGFATGEYEPLLYKSVNITLDTVDRFRVRLADMFFGTQQYQKAADNYRRALEIRERYEADIRIGQDVLLLQLARSLQELGYTDRALGFALQATTYNPKNQEARDFIYSIWMNGQSSTVDSVKKHREPS